MLQTQRLLMDTFMIVIYFWWPHFNTKFPVQLFISIFTFLFNIIILFNINIGILFSLLEHFSIYVAIFT